MPQEARPVSPEVALKYSRLEEAAPHLSGFRGGGTANGLWIGVLVLCLIVIGFYYLFIEPGRFRR
jgi:hypothetical protein